jgi:microcystin degradation protein MlrC
MVDSADLLIAYKEYPHTDVLERGLELVDLCAKIVEKKVRPVPALVDCAMIVTVHTSREPGPLVRRPPPGDGGPRRHRLHLARARLRLGRRAGDGHQGPRLRRRRPASSRAPSARRVADELIGLREKLSPPNPTIDAALDEALALPAGSGPVVISDGADNPGGGAASDATFFLRRIVERGIRDVAIGPFWDPVAARMAIEAGEGARLMLRIGGKVSPLSGDPIDLECTVKAVRLEHWQTAALEHPRRDGRQRLVEANGVEILLSSLRNQAMGTDLFTGIGCDLAAKRIVVVKVVAALSTLVFEGRVARDLCRRARAP